jgi:hypothetical protein
VTTLSPLATWLRTRTPPPPDGLAARIASMTAAHGSSTRLSLSLLASAESAMTALLGDGCLTRESALDLLAVDALITYAFEAAADDPEQLEECAGRALATIATLAEPYRA